jgi:hypothetical protein
MVAIYPQSFNRFSMPSFGRFPDGMRVSAIPVRSSNFLHRISTGFARNFHKCKYLKT